jgi:peptidyl-prolyl cis-trans isomerase D
MITWIENHLIRHGRWIFITLLAVVIVAFVGTIGNTPGCTTNRSNYEALNYYGYDLNSEREMRPVSQRLFLSNQLNKINSSNNEQLSQQMLSRIAMLDLADKIGIPGPNPIQLGEYIGEKELFLDQDGNFDRDVMTRFVDTIESDPSIPNNLLPIVLAEDYRIQQIAEAFSGPGYLLEEEALLQAQRRKTSYTLATATINYADFNPEIVPEKESLLEFYNNNTQRYEIPQRVEVSYLNFASENYVDAVAELDEDALREHFIANRARFVSEYEAAQATDTSEEKPTVKFDMVKDSVATSLKTQRALRLANEAAQNFAFNLYNKAIPFESAAFNAAVNETGLQAIAIEPYSVQTARERDLPVTMLNAAFALNESRYFSDPYPIGGGFGVLLYKMTIPAELPAFEAVETDVIADFTVEEKRRLFFEEGESVQKEMEAQLASGVSFEDAAAALKLSVENFDSFELSNPPQALNRNILQTAMFQEEGSISPMLQVGPAGIFIYVSEKVIPEISPDDTSLEQTRNHLIYTSSMIRMNGINSDLVEAGMPVTAE